MIPPRSRQESSHAETPTDLVRRFVPSVFVPELAVETSRTRPCSGFEQMLHHQRSGDASAEGRGAKVVKAFNTQFAAHMDSGAVDGQQLTTFAAGDDASAKEQVIRIARDIGFDAVDAGPLQNARLLEPLGYFNIQLGYALGLGTGIGLKLVHA